MKKLSFKYLAMSLLASLLMINATAQDVYKLNEGNSKLLVTGTSTIHDWDVNAEKFSCETTLKKVDANTVSINNIDFKCQAEEVKSHNRIMDSKTHDAIKAEKYPVITFRLANPVNVQSAGGQATVKGMLTIAGKTQAVNVASHFGFKNDQTFTVTGEVPLKLSDFGIDPPTAMMGALKTGNEVVIKYNFEFDKASSAITRNN